MSTVSPVAQELNDIISRDCPGVFPLLSERGKAIFFPKKGIMAQTAEAKGCKVNAVIGIGLEDDGTPMRLPTLDARIGLEPKDIYPYAPSYGLQEFREIWKTMMLRKNPSLSGTFSMPVVTSGLTSALSIAAYMTINEGESLITSDKFWGNYKLMFTNPYGVQIDTFNTFTETGFDLDALAEVLTKDASKKTLLLNFPNNPSGYLTTKDEALEICALLTRVAEQSEGLTVILDDAYFGLAFEDSLFEESLFAILANAHEKLLAIKVDGPTKEDYVWGFRVGCITFGCKGMTEAAAKAFEDKAAGCVRGLVSNVSRLSQSLLFRLYSSPNYHQEKKEKFELLRSRYQAVKGVLTKPEITRHFRPLPFNSGYFMCVELAEGLDAEEVRQKLLKEHSIGVISTGNLIRIAYSCLPESQIEYVFTTLAEVCTSLTPTSHEHAHTE